MLFSERVILTSNTNTINNNNNLRNSSNNNSKYEYISDKLNSLNNNSISSSISSNSSASSSSSSSSSSATNSSLNGSNTYIEPKYSQMFQMKLPNSTPGTTPKNPVYNSPRFSYLTLSPNIKRHNNNNTQLSISSNSKKIDDQSSQYNKKCDLLNFKDNKFDQQRQSLIVNCNNINNKNKTNQLNDRLLASQTKMTPNTIVKNSTLDTNLAAQIRNKQNKQPQSSSSYTYHTYNPNRLSSYDNDIYEYNNNNNINANSAQQLTPKQQKSDDLDTMIRKNTLNVNQRASIAIPSSSTKQSNIHLLKSCVNSNSGSKTSASSSNLFTRAFNYAFKKNINHNNNNLDGNVGKLSWKSKLGKFFPPSASSRKLNKEEGCDIIDDDLYESATYHLSRRQPIKKQSLNENLISTCSPLTNNNSNENNLSCLAGNNSSSAFSNSFNDNTPYSSNQLSTNNTTNNKKNSSSSKRSRAKCLEKTSSSTTNLNRSSPCLNKELTKNNNIINNGFNSLRKILKISNKQIQNKQNTKCSSASSTPVPPSMKLNSFDKLKETKLITNSPINHIKSSLSSSNASLMHKQQIQLQQQQQQHQNQQLKDNESSVSKCSFSKHGSNLTKSIINQTSSMFSSYSASLSSSLNDATSNKSKSNIILDNLEQSNNNNNNKRELNESKISLIKQDSIETSNKSTKLEEDKNKALKMLDYYKSSISQTESKDVSKSNDTNLNNTITTSNNNNNNSNVKISSAEIFLTKNILINNDDSDYYEISKKTNENENVLPNTNTTNSTNNNNTNNTNISNKRQSNDELVSTNTNGSKTFSITNSNSVSKVKHVSNDEEILCDLEVASYFDDKQKFKNSDEDSYFYENNQENNSDSKSSNNDDYFDDDEDNLDDEDDILDDVIDDELDNQDDDVEVDDEDDDSNNLEILVRQLAAEATLSLKGKKINVNTKNYNYDNSIMNKKLEKDYPYENKPCILKNKIFNCSNENSINKKYNINNSSNNNTNNFISDEEEELVYDLESNFGLNDYINDVYNDDKIFIKSKNSKNDINNKYDDDYDYGSYSKSDTSDSLNGVKTSTLSFNILNGETIFNNNNNQNKISNKGFSSLRNKSKGNIYNVNPNFTNTNQFYDKKQLDLQQKKSFLNNQKRSSSSSSCQQSHVVKLINHPHQYQSQQQRQLVHQPRKDIQFNTNTNSNIKIEKKIRLNYNRPQNFNSILNFGTLC